MIQIETDEIQGIVISGYGHLPYSKYLFLHINDSAKAKEWLNQLIITTPKITISKITTSNWNTGPYGSVQPPQHAINIAFTHQGLQKLGLPQTSLDTFSREFIEGMAKPYRSQQLGDIGHNAPPNWDFGGLISTDEKEIHALLILQAKLEEIDKLYEEQQHLFESIYAAGDVLVTETGYLPADGKEHFGFRDSISQPEIEGSPKAKAKCQDCIKAGEFILGYPNEDGNLPPTPFLPAECLEYDRQQKLQFVQNASANPKPKDLGRNGSYLVFRKLRQDVAEFRRYFEQFGYGRELMEAKLMGRWHDGQPLVLAPDFASRTDKDSDLNDFSYMKLDPHGYRCPLGAHIRRANPRDSFEGARRRRILRRGALYNASENGKEEQGLLFIGINADIRRQFEFIQQTWINNPNFKGLDGETDPILGTNPSNDQKATDCPENALRPMTIQKQPIRQRLNLPDFVSVKGGEYFFLPSIAALRFLANMPD